MRKYLFLCSIVLLTVSSHAQPQEKRHGFISRYIHHLVNDTSDISKPQFFIYPTLAYAPETSWEFGVSSALVFYTHKDTTNRLSEVNGFTFITLEKQYGIWFDHALYSQDNTWFSLGRLRFQSFPFLYFGIGPDSPDEHLAQVNANLAQVRERVLRRITKSFYGGIEVDFQHLGSVEFLPHKEEIIRLPHGSSGSTNLGIGAGIIYDDRHNVLNVRKGFFSELAFLNYNTTWGSDHNFTQLISDTRLYRPMNKRDVLAIQLLGQFNIGKTPFNQLALMGGESIMRGYYLGRYRDNNQVATQVEYRFLPLKLGFTKRLGAAVFASAGTVFNKPAAIQLNNFVWAGGGGLRFLLFPKKDIFTRLDVAYTKDRNFGFYIFIGEAF